MKVINRILSISSLFLLFTFCQNTTTNTETISDNELEKNDTARVYDEALAEELGADDYGMKKYIFALLKAGPNRNQDSTTAAQIQRAHLDNITELAEEGNLVIAGPFLEEGEFQGIFVFNVETIQEAEELTKTDPAVQAGRLVFEFYPWYSSATLQLINEWHKKVAKVQI